VKDLEFMCQDQIHTKAESTNPKENALSALSLLCVNINDSQVNNSVLQKRKKWIVDSFNEILGSFYAKICFGILTLKINHFRYGLCYAAYEKILGSRGILILH